MKQNQDLNKDRRVFERIPVCRAVRLLDVYTSSDMDTTTCDLSAKGLGIVSKEYLEPNDRLEIWLDMPDRKEPFYTRGKVVWSRWQDTGKYRVGICLEKAEFMGMSRVFRN